MQVLELSDHPGAMLRETRKRRAADAEHERLRFEGALAQHHERVSCAVQERDRARAERHWRAWLRGIFAVRRERRQAPAAPRPVMLSSDQEGILTAGVEGELLVAASLGRALGDEWTLVRGYRNSRGEIDHLLVGPRGLFAIEGKHRNAMVHCAGDRWWFTKYDKYGNVVGRGDMTDRRGRSPSVQLNEPASQLENFLRARGHPVAIQRVVLLTHPRSQLGNCTSPTVHITTSTDQVIKLLNGSQMAITADERTQLERLIARDHRYHEKRRSYRGGTPATAGLRERGAGGSRVRRPRQ
jgi:hypothetical protein